jgi:hypothetical protein
MNVIEAKFSQLRDQLESIAFLVSKGGNEKQAHSELVRLMSTLAEIERVCSVRQLENGASDKHATEEKKVRKRLKLWALPDRQNQINVRILNAFLRLRNSKSVSEIVTEDDLKRVLPDVGSFDSNFAQMKTIAEKNHGKVFEQNGSEVVIWERVLPYVTEYERATKSPS